MILRVVSAASIGALLFLAGCHFLAPTDPVVCLGVISRAIEVEVRDAETGQPAAHGAVGIAREGNFVDSLQISGWMSYPSAESALMLGGVEERPGLYSIRVEKDGYEPWERSGVRADKDACGVITVRLRAYLERAEP
jgi:hypothetical protein